MPNVSAGARASRRKTVLAIALLGLVVIIGAFVGLIFFVHDGDEMAAYDPRPRARADDSSEPRTNGERPPAAPPAPPSGAIDLPFPGASGSGSSLGASTAAPLTLTATPVAPATAAPVARTTATPVAPAPAAPVARTTAAPVASRRSPLLGASASRPRPAPRRIVALTAAPVTDAPPGTSAPREDPLGFGLSMTTESVRNPAALFRPARWIWAGEWSARTVSVTLTMYDYIDREGGEAGEMLIVQTGDECSWEGLSDLWASFDDGTITFAGGGSLSTTSMSPRASAGATPCADLPPEKLSIVCERPTSDALAAAFTLPSLTCEIARAAGTPLAALFRPN